MKNKTWALIVKCRTYWIHVLIALTVLVVDAFIFVFFAEAATSACAEIKRVSDAPHNEIVFSDMQCGEDSLFYLKQSHVVGAKDTNVSCDIFMLQPEHTYEKNDLYFTGTLEAGTCAVSQNLARQYGLRLGDSAKIVGTDKSFIVSRFLKAQSGIDNEYLHEGIILVSYDAELLERPHSFVSFSTDGDAYPSLISLVYIKDWAAANARKIVIYAAVSFAAFLATAALCEWLLFPRRRRDYHVLVSLGRSPRRLFFDVWLENIFKYIPAPAALAAGFSSSLSCFGAMYAAPILFYLGLRLVCITVYSFIFTRRLVTWRTK